VTDSDPNWYKDAIIYQLHVRAFADSDADGIGDFRGLAGKLDYLKDLGVSVIWLLPFYPSPLRDDGYDIADYTGIHPDYGTLQDFRYFLREAHRRELRVITELVVNHTSDRHPWFLRARRSPAGSNFRDYYVWSDTPDRYKEARIIFKDFESSNWSWDPVAEAYFWHRFYHHQPDLNYDNPEVRKAVHEAMDFWLEMGVDGLRLDAVPYLFEREGTNCENLPETHIELKALRRHVDSRFPNRMLLAEANQWPEDAVAYFGDGDECHMAFHFPVMPRMFMAARMEDRYPIIDILTQTPPIPETCQWAIFLRNHDELTLEMVTDEERDYMYRVYAHDPRARINLGIRRRLAPLLSNSRRQIELMNGLLLSLPGTPIVYYGDEINMGDNIYLGDRNGVRTPMQWSGDRNAGFSRANSQRLYLPIIVDPEYHYEAVNVEAQQNNPSSLLWWMKRLIALRKRFLSFSRGTIEFLYPENRKVLAYLRRHGDERILVVANLSRQAQYVELDLAEFKGMTPLELFGQTEFPPIGELPYLLTLGPYSFYWFSLCFIKEETIEPSTRPVDAAVPTIRVRGGWETVFHRDNRERLERVLPGYLRDRRWFAGKARRIQTVALRDAVPVGDGALSARVALVTVEYTEGDPEVYQLPMLFVEGNRAEQMLSSSPQDVITRLVCRNGEGLLVNALIDSTFNGVLLESIARRRVFKGQSGAVAATPGRGFRKMRGPVSQPLEASLMRGEQSNSSILYGDRLILKLYRRIDTGVNPDLELGRFLTERAKFPHSPPVAGSLEYRRSRGESMTLGILQRYTANEGDAWSLTLDVLGRYFERVASRAVESQESPEFGRTLHDLASGEPPEQVRELVGMYLESARLLGTRTAELHLALSTVSEDADLAPEPFTSLYQRSLFQSLRNDTVQVMELLRKRQAHLPETVTNEARIVLDRQDEIQRRFRSVSEMKITALRTRIHGDFHLGQVLYTGKDFVIIDFEGEPARSLSARRLKRSPLRDVAGMLRSFHYAGYTAFFDLIGRGVMGGEGISALEPWAQMWISWVSATFLRSYLETAGKGRFLPSKDKELRALLDAFVLQKALYELGYELNSRPDWVRIPVRGILQMLGPRS
jgi:maltose alpha-D-glucosyltransferase/alpha-amylase